MTIGFLVLRNTYFKFFGPVIEQALKSGHQVFCLHDYNQPKEGSKGYQFPDIERAPVFQNGKPLFLSFKSNEDFIEQALNAGVQAIVSIDFLKSHFFLQEKLKEKGIFWFSLQNGFDSGPLSGEHLEKPNKFFVYSPEWTEWMFDYLRKTGKTQEADFSVFKQKLNNKVEAVGFWPVEQQKLIDSEKVRNKWAIPNGKKVVLFLPFPFGSSLKKFWTKYVYGTRFFSKENDYNVCSSVKEFCEKNNCYLLVKSRQKDPVRNYLKKMADKVLYDEEFYPSTIMECLSVADICFNFYSTAAIEAVSMSVPNVCIAPNVKDWKDIDNVFWQTILEKEKDFFDFPGISYLKTIPEIIKELPQKTLSDFPLKREKQIQYMQKFAAGNKFSFGKYCFRD